MEHRVPRLYLPKGQPGEVLDRYEVYNSVEVVAPGIELEEYRGTTRDQGAGKSERSVLRSSVNTSSVNTYYSQCVHTCKYRIALGRMLLYPLHQPCNILLHLKEARGEPQVKLSMLKRRYNQGKGLGLL